MDISIGSAATASPVRSVEASRPGEPERASPFEAGAPSSAGTAKAQGQRSATASTVAIAEANKAEIATGLEGVMTAVRAHQAEVSQDLRVRDYHAKVGGGLDVLASALPSARAAHETEYTHIGRIEKWLTYLDRLAAKLQELNPSTYTPAETSIVEQAMEIRQAAATDAITGNAATADSATIAIEGQANVAPNTVLHLLTPPAATTTGG